MENANWFQKLINWFRNLFGGNPTPPQEDTNPQKDDKNPTQTRPEEAVIRLANPHQAEPTPEDIQKVSKQLADAGLPLVQPNSINIEEGTAVVKITPKADVNAPNLGTPLVEAWHPVETDDNGHKRYYLPNELLVLHPHDDHHSTLVQKVRSILTGTPEHTGEESQHKIGEHTYNRAKHPEIHANLTHEKNSAALAALQKETHVPIWHKIEVDYELLEDVVRCLETKTPPNLDLQWGMRNTGQTVENVAGTPGADSKAWDAQDFIKDNNLKPATGRVIVAVVDTGVDTGHPNLKANILPQGDEDWNFATKFNKKPVDNLGHGSHCAGIAAAPFIGQDGVKGAAPEVLIMPIKINLALAEYNRRAEALTYIADYASREENLDKRFVITCSWKTGPKNVHSLEVACKYAAGKPNVLLLFSAGNGDRNLDVEMQYPAGYPEVFTVGATESHDKKSTISNWGSPVDICSPGQAIYSTFPRGTKPDNPYCFLDGTSMATPLVAGCAALIWSHAIDLSPTDIRDALQNHGDDIDHILKPQYRGKLGLRVNALKALKEVLKKSGGTPS